MKMEKPDISPDFTIEDIRKLREYNSLRHKNMSLEELQAEMKESREEFERFMAKCKAEKNMPKE